MEIKNGDHYLSQVKDAGCGVYVQKAKMMYGFGCSVSRPVMI